MSYTYILNGCHEKQFVFEFSFDNESKLTSDLSNSRAVSYKLYRKDKPDEGFNWEGCLSSDTQIPFELSFVDKIDIKGIMRLYIGHGRDFIWIDVSYCQELQQHFEGNIIEIPIT
ncbi:hypothetical protein [uncultured Dokdonia sp.]|uniref:hypothetical protein n=1 Tax=uncultured Dokdonia sp. TaxID=575653 RepID=UPI00261AE850|nr:hypothetical protein [uncultured Dokdonia sp.]